jgi:hypothetical protein
VAVAGGVDAVNTGADWAGLSVIVREGVTASGLTPLAAATVNVATPAAVGVPERTPLVVFRLSPAGRAPEAILKVGAGSPLAVNVYVYAAPTVAVAGGVDAVNTGAAGAGGAGRISIKDRFHLSVVGAVSKILTEEGAVAVPGAVSRCVQNVSLALERNSSTLV